MSIRTLSSNLLSSQKYNRNNVAITHSVAFDGVDDYLTIGTTTTALAFGTGDYTVEAFVRPQSNGTSQQIISSDTSGRFCFAMGSTYGANALGGLRVAAAISADFDNCSFTFTAATWYHVAVVRSSGTVTFYVNGTSRTNNATANSTRNWAAGTSVVRVSSDASSTPGQEAFEGNISNLRVVKGTAVYTSNFTAPTSPLEAVTNTSLLVGQTPEPLIDKSTNAYTVTAFNGAAISTVSPFA